MAVNPNANTAIGGDMIDNSEHLSSEGRETRTFTFKRTLQHYITNNNASSVPRSGNTAAGSNSGRVSVQGWQWIPYTYTGAAMTQADADMIVMYSKYRIKSQGFRIVKLNAMQVNVNNNASTTAITNSFVQAPSAMLFRDDRNELFENVYQEQAGLALGTQPIWQLNQQFFSGWNAAGLNPLPNISMSTNFSGFANAYAPTNGTLPTVQIQFLGNITGGPNAEQVDLLNGGNIELLQSGQVFEYNWENKIFNDWYTPAAQQTGSIAPWPPGVPSISAGTGAISGNMIQLIYDSSTQVLQKKQHIPQLFLLRVPPLQDSLGNITINMECWIEYHLTVEVQIGRYLYGRASVNTGMTTTLGSVVPWPTNARSVNQPQNVDPLVMSEAPDEEEKVVSVYNTKKRRTTQPDV